MITYAPHQLEASYFLSQRNAASLNMATGTGKSVTMILTALRLLNDQKIKKAIICATKGSLSEIMDDFKSFYDYTPVVFSNTTELKAFFKSSEPIGLLRYEWFKNIDNEAFKSLLNANDCALFVDEAQRLKNPTTQAHKYIKSIRMSLSNYYPVTATPLMTNLDDLYWLTYLVDPRILGYYKDFTNNYYIQELVPRFPNLLRGKCKNCGGYMKYAMGTKVCVKCGTRVNVPSKYDLVEYKNLDILTEVLKDYMFCFYPSQDIRHIVYETEMHDYINYYKIAKDLIDDLSQDESTPFSTRMIQLQYATSNDINKFKLLKNVIDKTIDEGLVLYCHFQQSIQLIEAFLDSLKIDHMTISGTKGDTERDLAKSWFKHGAANKILIISSAAGASLNLQVTPNFCFYEIPYGYGAYSQAIGRICRMFSKYKTFYIHYLCLEDTIDKYKYECIASYAPVIQGLLNNKYLPTGQVKHWNKHIISSLRQSMCWKN